MASGGWREPAQKSKAQNSRSPSPISSLPATTYVPLPEPAITHSISSPLLADFMLPLRFTIAAGAVHASSSPAVLPAGAPAEIENVVIDRDYSDRAGYVRDFLDSISVPLPEISPEMESLTARVHPDAVKNDTLTNSPITTTAST